MASETSGQAGRQQKGAGGGGGSPRWIRWLLLASLALNLVVVGVVAGGFLRHGGPERGGPPHGRDFIAPYASAFTDDQRRELGRRLFASFEQSRGDGPRRGPFRAYRETLELLRAEPFDRAAFEQVLSTQDARAAERQKMGQRVLVDFVSGLSAQERAAYAERLEGRLDNLAKRFSRKPRD